MTTPPPPAAVQPLSESDARLWATLVHVGGIIIGFVSPVIVYLVFKDRSEFVKRHSTEALNFQLTLLIAYIAGSILTIILIGGIIVFAAAVVSLIFSILAALAANKGQEYKYPFSIKFIK